MSGRPIRKSPRIALRISLNVPAFSCEKMTASLRKITLNGSWKMKIAAYSGNR
jgi:hypothetical protein